MEREDDVLGFDLRSLVDVPRVVRRALVRFPGHFAVNPASAAVEKRDALGEGGFGQPSGAEDVDLVVIGVGKSRLAIDGGDVKNAVDSFDGAPQGALVREISFEALDGHAFEQVEGARPAYQGSNVVPGLDQHTSQMASGEAAGSGDQDLQNRLTTPGYAISRSGLGLSVLLNSYVLTKAKTWRKRFTA
jgi:hypothetical protein